MGMDLVLNIVTQPDSKWWLLYSRISLDRDYKFFNAFGLKYGEDSQEQIVFSKEISKDIKLTVYTDEGCSEDRKNPYGEDMTYFLAKDIKKTKLPKSTPLNNGVIKLIKELPDETAIVLEWR